MKIEPFAQRKEVQLGVPSWTGGVPVGGVVEYTAQNWTN